MKVLITGASGQVGTALLASAPAQIETRTLTREHLDIRDAGAVRSAVEAFRPALIINAAAYTAVDKAESEPELALAINAEGPRHLAQAAHALPGCRLLHISTDYVFDGAATEPYKPGDPTNPLSVYGRSKLLGEGTPTAAASIARALWALAQRPQIRGILHWTDAGQASWYDFAVAIAQEGHAAGLLRAQGPVTPITTDDYPTLAHRPANSVLDTRESIAQLGLTPPPWRVNLRATLANIAVA